jgi:hypothetical protein
MARRSDQYRRDFRVARRLRQLRLRDPCMAQMATEPAEYNARRGLFERPLPNDEEKALANPRKRAHGPIYA